ncbi:hypothetical protein A616_17315 [Brevibacillus brevis X23]|nr:hypothetical protein A616_17315 [Brevibacillus brevis X23]
MAKRTNAIGYNGAVYINPDNNHIIVAEYDKKTEETSYFDLTEEIKQFFVGVSGDVAISISEKATVQSQLEDPFSSQDEDQE